MAAFAFYLFAAILLAAGTMVVVSRNPVHAVLFLILAFFNAAGLFLLAGAEFLAMILVIVYVGAVAVLFLFVVMMLDVEVAAFREGFVRYLPVGGAIGGVLLVELLLVAGFWVVSPAAPQVAAVAPSPEVLTNTEALGRLLYTRYVLLFQAAGMVLLTAMIGAIVLTLRDRRGVAEGGALRQDVAIQVARKAADTLVIRRVPVGVGMAALPPAETPLPVLTAETRLPSAVHDDGAHDHVPAARPQAERHDA